MSGTAIAPSVIAGLSGLGGATIGAFASTWAQRGNRREDRRRADIEVITAFCDAIDLAAKRIQADWYLAGEDRSADGQPSITAPRHSAAKYDDLRPFMNAMSLAHSRLMITIQDKQVRQAADALGDSAVLVASAIETWEVQRQAPGAAVAFSPYDKIPEKPFELYKQIQPDLAKFVGLARHRFAPKSRRRFW